MKIIKKTIKDKKTLTIKRSVWARGIIKPCFGKNNLLNSDGSMCCLGQQAKSNGFPDEMLLNVACPSTLADNLIISKGKAWSDNSNQIDIQCVNWKTKLVERFIDGFIDKPITEKLMEVNDDCIISETEREKEIRKLFKKIGIKVRFVD